MANISLSVEFGGSTISMDREAPDEIMDMNKNTVDEFRNECHKAVDAAINALEATIQR